MYYFPLLHELIGVLNIIKLLPLCSEKRRKLDFRSLYISLLDSLFL